MSVLAIEINDAGIVIATESVWREEGPGFALLDPEGLLLGAEARGQARLRPRRANNRFWAELSTEPMPRPEAYARSHADLACAQLAGIWQRRPAGADSALFVVPPFMPREALGLLLGIAGELEIPVTGMVDSAVAASTARAPGQVLVHLDVHLHAAMLTRIEQGAVLERADVALFPRAGVQSLEDAWAGAVAGAFVGQTRFDPLHSAQSEQALHDRLAGWLAALEAQEEVVAQLDVRDRAIEARLGAGLLFEPAAEAFRALAARMDAWRRPGMPLLVQLTGRAARLPGLNRFLEALPGVRTRPLEVPAPARGALARREEIAGSGEVRFVTRLPALETLEGPEEVPEPAPAVSDPRRPTHLLFDGEAVPVGADGLAVGLAPPGDRPGLVLPGPAGGVSRLHFSVSEVEGRLVLEDHSRYGTFVNETRVQGTVPLAAGDRIRVGAPGLSLEAIRVKGAP